MKKDNWLKRHFNTRIAYNTQNAVVSTANLTASFLAKGSLLAHLLARSPFFVIFLPIAKVTSLAAFQLFLLKHLYETEKEKADKHQEERENTLIGRLKFILKYYPNTMHVGAILGVIFVLFVASVIAAALALGYVSLGLLFTVLIVDIAAEIDGIFRKKADTIHQEEEIKKLDKYIEEIKNDEKKSVLLAKYQELRKTKEDIIEKNHAYVKKQIFYLIANDGFSLVGVSLLIPASIIIALSSAIPPIAIILTGIALTSFVISSISGTAHIIMRRKIDLDAIDLQEKEKGLKKEIKERKEPNNSQEKPNNEFQHTKSEKILTNIQEISEDSHDENDIGSLLQIKGLSIFAQDQEDTHKTIESSDDNPDDNASLKKS